MSKRLVGGIIGCKDKTSSWYLIGFPDGCVIGSTVLCRGETQRYTVHFLLHINRHAATPNKTKTKDTMSLDYSPIYYFGSRIGWVSMQEIFKSWM